MFISLTLQIEKHARSIDTRSIVSSCSRIVTLCTRYNYNDHMAHYLTQKYVCNVTVHNSTQSLTERVARTIGLARVRLNRYSECELRYAREWTVRITWAGSESLRELLPAWPCRLPFHRWMDIRYGCTRARERERERDV